MAEVKLLAPITQPNSQSLSGMSDSEILTDSDSDSDFFCR